MASISSPRRFAAARSRAGAIPEFARLPAAVVARCVAGFQAELVVSIPPKPGQEERFRNIRREVAARVEATDGGAVLALTRVVADYRQMTIAQRLAAAGGWFTAKESVSGPSVLLIDDVLIWGAQASGASHALNESGAADLRFIAVARATGRPAAPEGRSPIARRGLLHQGGAFVLERPVRSSDEPADGR